MANRMQSAVSMLSFEKLTKVVFATVNFGASGAPTLVAANSKGVLSVTRASAGRFVFTFGTPINSISSLDTYYKFLQFTHNQVTATAPAAPSTYVASNLSSTFGTSTITIQYNLSGTATDPASGEVGLFQFVFGDSSAP